MNKSYYIKSFLKNNIVAVIAFIAAVISCFFVFPDKQYADYFDLRTLISLFGMSAVIAALKNQRFFRILARKVIKVFRSTRSAVAALVAITYIASMLIANDMALLTFLPRATLCCTLRIRNNTWLTRSPCRPLRQTSAECLLLSAIRKICIFTTDSIFPRANFFP